MTERNHEEFPDFEQEPKPERIANLLPRYYEAFGDKTKFEVERSIMVDNHEVAWLKCEGEVEYDMTGQGREGEAWTAYELECACKFTEDLGWRQDDDGQVTGLIGDKCIKKDAAVYLRQLELRQEYKTRGMFGKFDMPKDEDIEAIMYDLMDKVHNNEFIEGTSGASFYGGYYYLQTVAAVTDRPMKSIREIANKMVGERKIELEGAVVQPCREPEPIAWEEHTRLEHGSYALVASSPKHSQMPQTWSFEVFKQVPGSKELIKLEIDIPQEPLMHTNPMFGPDAEDVVRAHERLQEILDSLSE